VSDGSSATAKTKRPGRGGPPGLGVRRGGLEHVKHGTLIGNAREALIHGALERALPSIYEIGTGQVIDAAGNHSNQTDIIIARRDFPALRFPDGSAQYLVESVLATIEVKSKLYYEDLKEAMDNCHSIAKLAPSYTGIENFVTALKTLYPPFEFRIQPNGKIEQMTPTTEWDDSITPIQHIVQKSLFPETFVFSFDGYRSEKSFLDGIQKWALSKERLTLIHLPTVIAIKDQVGLRTRDLKNLDPIAKTWPLFFVAEEPNPLGCLLFHLLLTLHRVTLAPNTDGITPAMIKYLTPRTVTGPGVLWYNYNKK
jgi:hypothetical protein